MSSPANTNLDILLPSRRPLKVGSIFVCRPNSRGYLFGRIVAVDAHITTMRNCILIYVFKIESHVKEPPDSLSAMQLLIPPLMTNRLPWSRGYFETVAQREFEPGERLPTHCFRDPGRKIERYFDEYNRELPKRREPCGIHALGSYRTIDDAISDALNIPRAPD